MPLDTHIPSFASYNENMAKSMIDKIYFMDKVEADVFVDFGCADGILLKYLAHNFPDKTYIGYDLSPEMIQEAIKDAGAVTFSSNWDHVMGLVRGHQEKGQKVCLVLSSLIHEVYAYGGAEEVATFWKRVWESGFDFVAIRDMCVSETTSRPSDPITVARVRQVFDRNMLKEWESHWGNINENWSLVHFFLTYRYQQNWSREVRENYLPISLETLLSNIPYRYFPHHIEHYTLPFLRAAVEKDFGVQLQDRTHLKLILRRL